MFAAGRVAGDDASVSGKLFPEAIRDPAPSEDEKDVEAEKEDGTAPMPAFPGNALVT
ncbi:MAG: hypothetical protein WBX38_01475 [Candidatus Sulfotelmatobacter sp.]